VVLALDAYATATRIHSLVNSVSDEDVVAGLAERYATVASAMRA